MVKTLFGMNSPDWLVLALQLVTSGLYHKGLQLSFDTYGGHSLRSLQTQSEKSVKQQCTLQQTGCVRCLQGRTFTLQALFDQTPQQAPTVVTEGGAHVIVGFETVRHVNFKTLLLELWKQESLLPSEALTSSVNWNASYMSGWINATPVTHDSKGLGQIHLPYI